VGIVLAESNSTSFPLLAKYKIETDTSFWLPAPQKIETVLSFSLPAQKNNWNGSIVLSFAVLDAADVETGEPGAVDTAVGAAAELVAVAAGEAEAAAVTISQYIIPRLMQL
jgi:hypothetical protein